MGKMDKTHQLLFNWVKMLLKFRGIIPKVLKVRYSRGFWGKRTIPIYKLHFSPYERPTKGRVKTMRN